LPWEHHQEALPLLEALRQRGHELAAIETSERAIDLYDWQPRFPTCIVFGSETAGISPVVTGTCDVQVRIPMLGTKQSLNVAVAGGVVLFEMLRKYRVLHDQFRNRGASSAAGPR
jgi:tRNA G18 (ribose-2'-O)-methylase SpoU